MLIIFKTFNNSKLKFLHSKSFFSQKVKKKQINKTNYAISTLYSIYTKYKSISHGQKNNKFLFNFIKSKYSKIKVSKIEKGLKFLPKSNVNYIKQKNFSVYINLRKNNIFVTILDSNNKVIKTHSSGSCGIDKSLRKKSPSYFTVIKETVHILNQYSKMYSNNFSFKLFFKGFKRFRRPLLHRFIYNKTLKKKCVGIYNIDFEPFNGCRAKKAKRLKGNRS